MSVVNQGRTGGRIIGMDGHPTMFTVATMEGLDPSTARVAVVKDRLPIEQLEHWLESDVHPEDIIVLEASGNTFALVDRIQAKGRKAVVLESVSVGRIGKTYCSTDKLCAVKIARIYLTGLAHIVWKPDAKTMERRDIFFAYRNSVKDTTRCRNRIWAFFNHHGMRRPAGLRYALPQTEATILAMRTWTSFEKIIIGEMLAAFRQADERRNRLEAIIAEEVTSDPALLKLVRLMGIRHIVALALGAFIGDISRFHNPKAMVSYFGLNPRVRTSGQGGGNGSLSLSGRSDVRSLLIQSAHSILRYGKDHQHKWAVALKMRKGKNIAVAALARKLTVACWYLMRGFFTELTEISAQLATKIHKIACDIGATRLKDRGYKSMVVFENEIHKKLLQTSG